MGRSVQFLDMRTNKKGVDLIKKWEGYRDKAYICAGGVCTIGYGHTQSIEMGTTCTKEQAEQWLIEDIEIAERQVEKYDSTYHFTDNEFSALVSFAFNIGNINQLTANGKRNRGEIKKTWLRYNKAGGKVLDGLKKRRAEELKLFCNNDLQKVVCTSGGNLRIRAQPNTQSRIVARIPNGEKVNILESGYKWDKVFYKNSIGYVYKSYLKEV